MTPESEEVDPILGLPYVCFPDDYWEKSKDFRDKLAVGSAEWEWEQIGEICGFPLMRMKESPDGT